MKTDYDDYKRANKIKESWPEKTPLALRDKIFIALVVVIVLASVCHGLFSYGSLATSDEKKDLLLWLVIDMVLGAAVVAEMIFPRFFSKKLFERLGNEIVDGARLVCGVIGITIALFFGYVLETDVLGIAAFDVRVSYGFCAVVVIELIVYFVWLLRR